MSQQWQQPGRRRRGRQHHLDGDPQDPGPAGDRDDRYGHRPLRFGPACPTRPSSQRHSWRRSKKPHFMGRHHLACPRRCWISMLYGGQEAEKRKTYVTGATTTGLGSPTLNLSGMPWSKAAPARPTSRAKTRSTAGFVVERFIRANSAASVLGAQYSYTHLSAFSRRRAAFGRPPTTAWSSPASAITRSDRT